MFCVLGLAPESHLESVFLTTSPSQLCRSSPFTVQLVVLLIIGTPFAGLVSDFDELEKVSIKRS